MSPLRHIALCVLLLATTIATPASATSTFPAAMQGDLALTRPPACALCHTTGDTGGRGTVNTPFGQTIRAHGLVAYDEASLKAALDGMTAQKTDSDGDCVSDVDELKQGSDPNAAGASGMACAGAASMPHDTPQYGCGAHVAPAAPTGHTSLCILAIFAMIALRRRRT